MKIQVSYYLMQTSLCENSKKDFKRIEIENKMYYWNGNTTSEIDSFYLVTEGKHLLFKHDTPFCWEEFNTN